MTHTSDEWIQYLSLSDLIEMRYAVDSDGLEVFQVTPDGARTLYQGPLAGWLPQLAGDPQGADSEKLEAFCQDMRGGKPSFQYEFQGKDGTCSVRCKTEITDGARICYGTICPTGASSDLLFQSGLDKDAMLDMLNKKAIIQYAKHQLSHPEAITYLVILDLDNFKMVNDTYGHLFGDTVLVAFTEIINKAMGTHGVVGRLGGDEILIVTKDIPNKAALRPYLREIRTSMELAYKGKLKGISLTCSIGAAAYPIHAASYEEAMELADKMLYLAKEKGRNRYLIYTPELHSDYVKINREAVSGPVNPVGEYDNIRILQYMLSDFLINQASCNDYAFDQLGRSFRLSEILCIYNQGDIGFRWTAEGEGLREEDMELLDTADPFLDQVDDNGLYLMDGRYLIQDDFPGLYEKLAQRKIEAAVFYRLKREGKPDGYVLFARRHQRQKWSEYETMALAVAAKIFELSIYE